MSSTVTAHTSDIAGIAAMLAATAVFVVGDSFMKLVMEALPPFEVLFIRGIAASLVCAAILLVRGEWRGIAGALDPWTLLRAAGETFGTLCYVVALARMPIADVIAILQTAPLILIVGAALMFREKVGLARIGLVLAGFGGALLVAQPGASGLSSAALFAFAAAVLVAGRDLVGRRVPTRIPIMVVVFATMVVETLVSGAFSLGVETWVPPTGLHVAFLSSAAVCLSVGHGGLVLAYRLGRTALVAPFFYSFALWGVVAGALVWGALPDTLALFGIAAIIASGIAVVLLDQRRIRSRPALMTDAV